MYCNTCYMGTSRLYAELVCGWVSQDRSRSLPYRCHLVITHQSPDQCYGILFISFTECYHQFVNDTLFYLALAVLPTIKLRDCLFLLLQNRNNCTAACASLLIVGPKSQRPSRPWGLSLPVSYTHLFLVCASGLYQWIFISGICGSFCFVCVIRSVIVKFRFIYHWKLNRGFNFIW